MCLWSPPGGKTRQSLYSCTLPPGPGEERKGTPEFANLGLPVSPHLFVIFSGKIVIFSIVHSKSQFWSCRLTSLPNLCTAPHFQREVSSLTFNFWTRPRYEVPLSKALYPLVQHLRSFLNSTSEPREK